MANLRPPPESIGATVVDQQLYTLDVARERS
jgi:hypothetical protein